MRPFTWPARIYWEDTDAGGIVYYANYLKYLERVRTEYLRALGFHQSELARESGIMFTVVRLEIDYLRPARLDDELTITCVATRAGAASLRFEQQVLRGAEELAEARVRVACLDARTLRPTRLPAAMIAALS